MRFLRPSQLADPADHEALTPFGRRWGKPRDSVERKVMVKTMGWSGLVMALLWLTPMNGVALVVLETIVATVLCVCWMIWWRRRTPRSLRQSKV